MQPEEIAEYLQRLNLLSAAQVTLLGRGEANSNYLAESDGQRLVIRIARNDTPGKQRFELERHYLQFVESLGLLFAPRSVYYDADEQLHVISFMPGDDASIVELDSAGASVFITQLKQLDAIRYEQYEAWCAGQGVEARRPESETMRDKVNITDRLAYLHDQADDPFAAQITEWAEPKLGRLSAAGKLVQPRTLFLHGDLRWNQGGGNLRIDGTRVGFIDWEWARFIDGGAIEIADILGSIPSSDDSKATLCMLYDKYTSDMTDGVRAATDVAIEHGILWGKLGNPLWAAERYFILKNSQASDLDRYKQLTLKGMADANQYYSTPYNEWF